MEEKKFEIPLRLLVILVMIIAAMEAYIYVSIFGGH